MRRSTRDRPTIQGRPVGVFDLLTAPLLYVTFRGIFVLELARPALYVLGFAALYVLVFVTNGVYLIVPRWILTPMVTKVEAERHLRRHGGVATRALPLRVAWKRAGTWRRASLPRSGPYRLSAVRRVCHRLGVPVPRSEFELAEEDH